MSTEVEDLFPDSGDAGERIDTSRPAPQVDSTAEPVIEDPHRDGSVVTRGAAAARRARPAVGRYSETEDSDPEDADYANLFESQPGVAMVGDDRHAARRDRESEAADRAESARVAATSGAGAHREEDLDFFASDEADDEDDDPVPEDNDSFFTRLGIGTTSAASGADDAPVDPDDDFDIESIESGAKRKRTVARTVGLAAAATVVLGGGGYLAVSFVSGLVDSTRAETQQQYAAPEWATEVDEPAQSGNFDDLFSDVPAFTIDAEGSTYWVAAGIVDVTDEELSLYDTTDGQEITSLDYGAEDFDYLVEFYHEGEPVVGLRTAEGVTAIRADGEVADIDFDEGSLRAEGEAPLVYIDEVAHRIDFDEGLVEIDINNDLPVVAADDDLVYQVTGDGTLVTIPDSDDVEAAETQMQPPTEGAEFTGWAGAGHGFSGAYWQTDDGNFLGVHDAHTGEATAYVPVETEGRWEVGRGLSAATVDRYAISLITGEILAADLEISGAYSHYAYTEDRRFFDSDDDGTYVYEEDSRVIGASGQTVFIRTATGSVAAYYRSDAVA